MSFMLRAKLKLALVRSELLILTHKFQHNPIKTNFTKTNTNLQLIMDRNNILRLIPL